MELPSIHICPVSGSWGFFARRFLNKYSDQLSNDDQMAINRGVVNSLIMLSKNGRYRVDRNDYKVLINWCQEDEANGRTDGCQLSAILLEYALTNKGSELILEYLVKVCEFLIHSAKRSRMLSVRSHFSISPNKLSLK